MSNNTIIGKTGLTLRVCLPFEMLQVLFFYEFVYLLKFCKYWLFFFSLHQISPKSFMSSSTKIIQPPQTRNLKFWRNVKRINVINHLYYCIYDIFGTMRLCLVLAMPFKLFDQFFFAMKLYSSAHAAGFLQPPQYKDVNAYKHISDEKAQLVVKGAQVRHFSLAN